MNKKKYEFEALALVEQDVYLKLLKYLQETVGPLEQVNRRTIMYVNHDFSDYIKIDTADGSEVSTITVKSKQGQTRSEVTIEVKTSEIANYDKLLSVATQYDRYVTKQERYDATIDNVNISLKHTTDMGHHVEVEVVAMNEKELSALKPMVEVFAKKHGLKLLSEEEERDYYNNLRASRKIDQIEDLG